MIDLQQKTEERSRNNQADKSRKLYAVLGININEFMNISQFKFCDSFEVISKWIDHFYFYLQETIKTEYQKHEHTINFVQMTT